MNPNIHEFLTGFIKNPPANPEALHSAALSLGIVFPSDYGELLSHMNGGEGFVGDSYLRIYSVDELPGLNRAYAVQELAPGLVIFGSTGGGEAFAFDTRDNPPVIVRIPFIPMDFQLIERYQTTFTDFLAMLAKESGQDTQQSPHQPNPQFVGKEIHEVHPIVFGGDPTDPNNKVFLTPEEDAPFVVWWNRLFRNMHGEPRHQM